MSSNQHNQQLANLLNRQQRCLWIADENTATQLIQQVHAKSGIEVITNRYDIAENLEKHGFVTHFNDFEFDQLNSTFDAVVFPVCKERSLVHHCINNAFNLLNDSGVLYLLGEKNQGIKTHHKNAENVFGDKGGIEKIGNLYLTSISKTSATPAAELDSRGYPQLQLIETESFSFLSKHGVFGWDKIDQGSAFLMECYQKLIEQNALILGSVLDLGCGYGYLMLNTTKENIPTRVATDNNVAAVKAAQANFEAVGLDVKCTADNCGTQIQEHFDLILCNPPFHVGFQTNSDITRTFLSNTRRLLQRKGVALWVLNKFIAVEALATEYFDGVDLEAENGRFKVLRLHKPKR